MLLPPERVFINRLLLLQANSSLLALATPREIQEMDISLLLESPSWLEDECEFDLVNLSRLVKLRLQLFSHNNKCQLTLL